MSMEDLVAQTSGSDAEGGPFPFPSLDALNDACGKIPQSRDLTVGLEEGFLDIRDALRIVVDPITQPLSWMLRNAASAMEFFSLPTNRVVELGSQVRI